MGDTNKPDQGNTTSGKPNKFNQQNENADERKAGETPTQGEPVTEPTKEEAPAEADAKDAK